MTADPADGLFLHASAVVVDGGAVLFLGHSTAGKSTIARRLGEAVPVLADDSVYAAKGADGGWRVVDGGYRFGEGGLEDWQQRVFRQFAPASVPLRACWRIHKGAELRQEPMEPVELARHLMDAALEIDVQRKAGRMAGGAKPGKEAWAQIMENRRRWFGWVADIARSCPGGHLWFPKNNQASELRFLIEGRNPNG